MSINIEISATPSDYITSGYYVSLGRLIIFLDFLFDIESCSAFLFILVEDPRYTRERRVQFQWHFPRLKLSTFRCYMKHLTCHLLRLQKYPLQALVDLALDLVRWLF